MGARSASFSALVMACCLSAAPAVAQESDLSPADAAAQALSPGASPSASPRVERRDLLLDLPTQLAGMETQTEVLRGEEHLANLESSDPALRDAAADLADMLERLGASVDDLSSGYALVSLDDLFAFTLAVRVDGLEAGTLLPAYLPILLGDLSEPSTAEALMGGKQVLVITSTGADGQEVDLYVYDAGDTVWMVQGPEDVVDAVLMELP